MATINNSSSSEDLTQTEGASTGATEETTSSSMIDLLQRRRNELLNELTTLKQGERPVTGSDSRQRVDNLLSRRVRQQGATVANTDDVEEHRPEQVTIEVQGLVQRRSVSSRLQSHGFRRSLENVFRTHFTARPSALAQRRRADSRPTPEERAEPNSVNNVPVISNDRLETSEPAAPTAESTTTGTTTVHSVPEHVQRQQHQAFLEAESIGSEDAMRRWRQEQFVMEISELVHSQLVSSTLNGEFRDRLERQMRNRVNESGLDGAAVQDHILRLPSSHIRRNDFSHLGISSPQDQHQQLDDAVSVISATASASIPYAQSNRAVQRELSSMKAQISQLTSMLKMSLDLQMDIQRSIRQEVAAAIGDQSTASTTSTTSPHIHGTQVSTVTTAPTAQPGSQRADDSKCIICLDGDSDTVLYRCGHICMCYSCALRMKSESGLCPVCRAPINDIMRAYRITHEL